MPWCPECKSEYIEGTTECAVCNVGLVEEEVLANLINWVKVAEGEEELIKEFQAFLSYCGFEKVDLRIEQDRSQILVPEEVYHEAYKCFITFNKNREKDEVEREEEKPIRVKVYQDEAVKAQEMKSSAVSFIVVGALGLVALLLHFLGIYRLNLDEVMQYVFYAVLIIMSVGFIIIGIKTNRSVKHVQSKAEDEKQLRDKIIDWSKEYIKEDIVVNLEELTDEMMYFEATEQMKLLIVAEFGDLDEGFLEDLVEQIYEQTFMK